MLFKCKLSVSCSRSRHGTNTDKIIHLSNAKRHAKMMHLSDYLIVSPPASEAARVLSRGARFTAVLLPDKNS